MTAVTPYQVLVRGQVPDSMLDPYLDEFSVTRSDSGTTLAGAIVDASHLHGLISYLIAVGLEIVEVRRADERNPAAVYR